jgi:hypothetical protein
MPRRSRLAVAALLVALTILPRVVHLRFAVAHRHNPQVILPVDDNTFPAVAICFLDQAWPVEASSFERAKSVDYRWEQYRRLWWVFAAVAACVVVRPFLPIPAVFGPDDEETL